MAQDGTRPGRPEGKRAALRGHRAVERAGVLEPDAARRTALDRAGSAFHGVRWFTHEAEILADPEIIAVGSAGVNEEAREQTAPIVRAANQVWYDKPAGDDWG